jgi:hypothetical protein
MNPSQLQNHFDAFYEDFWCEMCKYGELEEVVVCDNNNDRMFFFGLSIPDIQLLIHLHRSDWKRIRAVQIRRLGASSLR